jgi:molybdopterin-containing oxidoreductase family iron-sulfur binding subunit
MVRDGEDLRAIGWDEAESLLAERLRQAGPDTAFVTGSSGPSFDELIENFISLVGGRRVVYDALSEAPLREATRIAFGQNVIPGFDIERARLVLSFGADFLETWLSPVEYGRAFGRMSAADEHGSKGRFVFLGPRLSLTGQNADEWVPIRPGSEGVVALALAYQLSGAGAQAGPYAPLVREYDPERAEAVSGVPASAIRDLAERFVSEGPSLALGPGVAGQHRNATAANLAVLILNAVAGNVGRTLHVGAPQLGASTAPFVDLESTIRAMAGGNVQVALVHGTNPAYSLPPVAGFMEAFAAVPFKVSFASALDETAAMADLILPDRHALESWGDSNPRPGVYALRQPALQPVPHFDSRQTGDGLLSVTARMGQDLGGATFFDLLRAGWRRIHTSSGSAGLPFDDFWREALRTGVLELEGVPPAPASLRSPDGALSFDVPTFAGEGEFVLIAYPSPRLGDGKHAHSPWLQELPDPVSKITWHSWVEIHPRAAERLGLQDGDVVRVRSEQGELEAPIWLYPGVREDVVAIAMGGGHKSYGRFADGNGVNVMSLLPAVAEQPSGALVHLVTRVMVEPTGARYPLASVSGSTDQADRPIAPAIALGAIGHGEEGEGGHGELQELQELGGFAPVPTEGLAEDFPLPGSQYGAYDPEDHPRWAMAIDLEKCTGCSACVTACQAENNVAWVGEDQIRMGRDLGWIRIESYYEAVDAHGAGAVDVRILPMLCQHCGNAPCEPVCPVYAAYHTPEGVNAQVYNRCVGTRYCANNCPYKVRVFNWLRYSDVPEPMNWQYNPDVTVRSNGVMEKCTFCVQRVREAQNRAVLEGREVEDGEIQPACQQSCPAQAITFGNVRDPSSRVARAARNERAYRVLDAVINTQPAVSYLKKVTFHEVEAGEH